MVGDREAGIFFSIPEIGVVALRELERGATISEATEVASTRAGQDVNVLEFADVLVQSGLVTAIDDHSLTTETARQRLWLEGLRPELVRPFFSRPAWALYVLLFLFCLVVFALQPAYWPSFEDFFFYPNPAVCFAVVLGVNILFAGLHELCHWLAARAAGAGAWFRISRRLFIPVFETDLSQLWSVPRRQRYSPFLAGMAFNTVVLAICLALRVGWGEGWIELPPLLVRFLGVLVLVNVIGLAFQAFVFLRTDLYAVLMTAFGCRNLYRINQLYLKSKLRKLGTAETQELDEAHPRDRQVARWFSLIYLAGLAGALYFFLAFFIPGVVIMAGWMILSVTRAPVASGAFWQALVIGLVLGLQMLLPLAVLCWEKISARRATA